jgi:methylase of polypeptide subunit release factors
MYWPAHLLNECLDRCGSGCVICYINMLLSKEGLHPICFGIDINRDATLVTRRTAAENSVSYCDR